MMTLIPISLIAGLASALMFASTISGAPVSMILYILAPLPLLVAAIGWGALSAVIGGAAAAIALALVLGLHECLAFTLNIALPASWLGHLVLLGREVAPAATSVVDGPTEPDLEWYPVGRILIWIAISAALTAMASLLALGIERGDIASSLRPVLLQAFRVADPQSSIAADQLVDALIAIVPAVITIVSMLTLAMNVWLAAKITALAGRLRRPWPRLMSSELPPLTLVALCVALALCFAGGLLSIAGQIATAALMTAYALTGFAVLHTVTLAMKSRTFWLAATYAVSVVLFWPVIAVTALGLADAAFGIRARFLSHRPPPLPTI
jgi:hypothetical protein